MKSEKEINIFLVVFCFVLLFFVILGAKMLDHQAAMQQRMDGKHSH